MQESYSIPILKNGEDRHSKNYYRPASIGNNMERMFITRLKNHKMATLLVPHKEFILMLLGYTGI